MSTEAVLRATGLDLVDVVDGMVELDGLLSRVTLVRIAAGLDLLHGPRRFCHI